MKLPLAYYGNPILRQKGSLIAEINDEIKELVNDMVETMDSLKGIGLAAPQVKKSLALFITKVPLESLNEEWLPGKLRIFINPKILAYSEESWDYSEGCLSIPKVHGIVRRPFTVRIEATNLEGEVFTEEFSGLEARCIMHENDHINGTLFIDRMNKRERKLLDEDLREVKKRFK